jgi:hypothetical protein
MDTVLIILVSVLVGAFALAFYMDWLGLWVSEAEMRGLRAAAKEKMQAYAKPIGSTTSVEARDPALADAPPLVLHAGGFKPGTMPRSFAAKNPREGTKS